jgi:hypothetical protein
VPRRHDIPGNTRRRLDSPTGEGIALELGAKGHADIPADADVVLDEGVDDPVAGLGREK